MRAGVFGSQGLGLTLSKAESNLKANTVSKDAEGLILADETPKGLFERIARCSHGNPWRKRLRRCP